MGGVVSTGASHTAVIHVLQSCVPSGLPASAERQLLGLLRLKNDIEYTERVISDANARVLVDQASRFVEWSRSIVERRD
jgi:hypothetical protein